MGDTFLMYVPKKGMLFGVQVNPKPATIVTIEVNLGKDGNRPARWSNQNRPEPGPE